MNKKIVIKVIACFLICMGFMIIGNHMPLFMRAVYNAVFGEFDHVALFFVTGVLLFEIIIIKRWGNDKFCYYICVGMAVIAAALVLFNGNTSFVDKLAPGADTTLIGRVIQDQTIDEIDVKGILAEYYFENKNLIISEEEKGEEEYQYIFSKGVPSQRVIIDQKVVISSETAQRILSYPCREYGTCYFVLDDWWEETSSIRAVVWENKHIFCSEELLENVLEHSDSDAFIIDEQQPDIFWLLGEMEENRPYRELKQIMVMLMLFLIGGTISLPLWGKEYPYLSFFLGLPVGAAIWCVCGVVLMMFNIPYNLFTALGCIVPLIGIWLFRKRTVLRELNWPAVFDFIILAVVVVVFLAYYKACYTSSDSLMKCSYGHRLAYYGSVRDILGEVAPYGILEPMIMSIGYLVQCDALYTFYPLMAICGLGIMCTGLYYISNKKEMYISIAILGMGIILLLTNYDFVMGAIVMLAHGPIAVYTLILIMFIAMKMQIDISGFEWIAVLAATVILLTRVEGAIYVLLFLAAALGIENVYLKMYRVNISVAGVIIVWNVFQIIAIGFNSDPIFWTPERGVLLIVGAILVLIATWFIKRQWLLAAYVRKHYFLFLLGAICVGIVGVTVLGARSIASINFPIFLSYFSNNDKMNDRINAGAFWTFVLLLCPIILKTKNIFAKYSFTVVAGYLLLVYAVCLFREEIPLHYGYFDSGRRTLVQIMPAAIWSFAYSAGEGIEDFQ